MHDVFAEEDHDQLNQICLGQIKKSTEHDFVWSFRGILRTFVTDSCSYSTMPLSKTWLQFKYLSDKTCLNCWFTRDLDFFLAVMEIGRSGHLHLLIKWRPTPTFKSWGCQTEMKNRTTTVFTNRYAALLKA